MKNYSKNHSLAARIIAGICAVLIVASGFIFLFFTK